MSINKTLEWKQLESHLEQELKSLDIANLFESDSKPDSGISSGNSNRFDSLSVKFDQLF